MSVKSDQNSMLDGLGWWKSAFLIALPAGLVAYVLVAGRGVYGVVEHEPPTPESTIAAESSPEPNGAALFAQNCAKCHGLRGNADGITSPSLNPWARRFGEDRFQLVSTTNGMPCDDDIFYVITHGIPGTAMPAFDESAEAERKLNEAERRALVGHVRRLAFAGLYGKLWKQFARDEEPDPDDIHTRVMKQMAPGPMLEIPEDFPKSTKESIERGAKIFGANCATCHGPTGAGDGPQVKDMKNDNGQRTKPRDIARGIFKGGGDRDRLYHRIALGMPGTPMPASAATVKPHDIGDLVNFVLSLVKPEKTPDAVVAR
jgi:mono/diheme cytochrome c family protein